MRLIGSYGRWLVAIVLLLGPIAAQGGPMQIELESGSVLHGTIELVEDDSMVVALPTGQVRVRVQDIVAVRPAPQRESSPVHAGDGAGSMPTEATTLTASSGPDRELLAFVERYLWFVPSTDGHRTSVGAAVLVALALLVQLAARMANIEERTFGRCVVFATVVLAMLIVELTVVPVSPILIFAVAGFDAAFWFVLGIMIFRADLFEGVILLASFMLSAMVGILLLQLAGVLVHADQLLV